MILQNLIRKFQMKILFISFHFLALLLAPWLCGCMVHQPQLNRKPVVAASKAYHEPPDVRGLEDVDSRRAAEDPWWKTFNDPGLDELIEKALQSNLDLRALAARIEQADALVRQAGGRLLPALETSADYTARTESSGSHGESASIGLDLSWEIDVWGRLRSAQRAAKLEAAAARWDWMGGCLLLSASVAETYFEILEQLQELDLLRRQMEVNETLLELNQLRFGQGQSSIVDVLQQREQLASTRALVPAIQARLEQLEYILDVLLGGPPGVRERLQAKPLLSPPEVPAAGVPLDLLQNRPDLLAAKERINALDFRVGEAIADRLPRLQIGGVLSGVGQPGIDTLVASAFALVVGPLYEGGIRKAEVDLRRGRLEEAIAEYSQAFLNAVGEVETAMIQVRKQSEHLSRLEEQLAIAQQLLAETRNRYSQGLTDYLPVLAAVVTVQDLERDLITSRRRHLSLQIALYRALGGPLSETPTAPESKTVS